MSSIEVTDEPMSAEELATIRSLRNDPEYQPPISFDPVHEAFSERELQVINPFLALSEPPDLDAALRIIEGTSPAARSDRYGTLAVLAELGIRRSGRWAEFAVQLMMVYRKRDEFRGVIGFAETRGHVVQTVEK